MLMGPRQSALLRQNPCISTVISQVVKKLTANIVHLNHEPEKNHFQRWIQNVTQISVHLFVDNLYSSSPSNVRNMQLTATCKIIVS